MRKILAGFMATSMVVAMASATTFAANRAPNFTIDLNDTFVVGGTPDSKTQLESVDVIITDGSDSSNVVSRSYPINKVLALGDNDATIGRYMNGVHFDNIRLSNAIYNLDFTYVGNGVSGSPKDLQAKFTSDAALPTGTTVKVIIRLNTGTAGTLVDIFGNGWNVDSTTPTMADSETYSLAAGNLDEGEGGVTSDVTADGSLTINNVKDIVLCDAEGVPIPLTKSGAGVDSAINDEQGVQSDNKVYFMIKEYNENGGKTHFDDENYYKIRVNKGDNAKQVKSVKVVSKNVSDKPLYNVLRGTQVIDVKTSGRHRFIEVELNPNYTTDEYKLTFDMRVTPTSDAVTRGFAVDGDELKIKDFAVWMKNIERSADNDWRVGINGLMLKPLANDWNEVTWFDEDGDVAHMKFFADSDVSSFFSKLSTKWEHADYASYFNDQDAYTFQFTGSPKLSSTSRADLEIYNPFVDDNGDETIDPSSAVIYQVIDGDLFDITDSFEYKESESGEMAFCTRTRFLGTYIICEKPVEEAVDDSADVPADLVPEDTTPSEVTPDNNNGGKAPANTGKYL